MTRIKRITSIIVTILAWGILGYAGYSIAIVIVSYAQVRGASASAEPAFVDDAAKVYLAPQCLEDWLRRNRAASAATLRATKFGEAYRLRYQRFDCHTRTEQFEGIRGTVGK
jgi:hypothetical protein